MRKPAVWIAALFIMLVVGYIFYSSFHTARYRCELCVTFNGRQNCRTAAAETRDHAMRTAIENACAELAAGVTDSTRCEQTRPDSVRWLQ
jgi:hypothetical protein